MRRGKGRYWPVPEAADGDIAMLGGGFVFTLVPGHPMRGSPCVVCRKALGAEPARICGAGWLGGKPCSCGAICSDLFLVHQACRPDSPADLVPYLSAALAESHQHDWEPAQ